MKIGNAFEFEPPVGWRESHEGSQHIFRSPKDEALIVSGYFVSGPPTAERQEICAKLFANARSVIQKSASNPELREIASLAKREEFKNLEVWSQHNITTDGIEAFFEAILISDRGMMLITLESFAAGDHMQIFRSVVSSVSGVPE
jgi:hypothetical protein